MAGFSPLDTLFYTFIPFTRRPLGEVKAVEMEREKAAEGRAKAAVEAKATGGREMAEEAFPAKAVGLEAESAKARMEEGLEDAMEEEDSEAV